MSVTTYFGTGGSDTITPAMASAGVTTLPLGALPPGFGDDVIFGNGGADLLDGGGGFDAIFGGGGRDTILADAGDEVRAENGADLIEALAAGIVRLDGGAGVDTLLPAAGVDLSGTIIVDIETLVLPAAGFEMFAGAIEGFRTLTGAVAGTGQVSLDGIQAPAVVASLAVQALGLLVFNGSASAEALTFTAEGADIVLGAAGGNDSITTDAGEDTLNGGGGDDLLSGRGGDDRLFGGSDSDTLFGGEDDDFLDGEAGADSLGGGGGIDTLLAGEDDSLDGGDGDDVLVFFEDAGALADYDGGDGIDQLLVSGGTDLEGAVLRSIERLVMRNDTLTLSMDQLDAFAVVEGVDEVLILTEGGETTLTLALQSIDITGSAGADDITIEPASGTAIDLVTIRGKGGTDRLTGAAEVDRFEGGAGRDLLDGGDGNDDLEGGAGNDLLDGGDGVDVLNGGAGADTIIGGLGADDMAGLGGADRFRYLGAAEGGDNIEDFTTALDRIEVSASGFGGGLVAGALLPVGRLKIGLDDLATAPAGTGQFIYNTATGWVLWDIDGTGAIGPVELVRLSFSPALVASDILVLA